ncbi:MAG: ArsC family (seleno)protein [Nannocystaceae bacterium]
MSKSVAWYYHRKNCETCSRSQDYLSSHDVAIAETTIANKIRYEADAALDLARGAREVWVAKGKKSLRLASRPGDGAASDDELLANILGPSGKLRAPAIRVGDTLVVGFLPELYDQALA